MTRSTRHSGSVEKLIEAYAEIWFFKLCGIALLLALTIFQYQVAASDVKISLFNTSLFPPHKKKKKSWIASAKASQ